MDVQMVDIERVSKNDKVLVVVTNQYMWTQLEWYRTKYPEGIWDALVINFGGKNLVQIMYDKCLKSNYFSNVYIYETLKKDEALPKKMLIVLFYLLQYFTKKRETYDEDWVKSILGNNDYQKVIVQSNHSLLSTAIINTFRDKILVCLEDGLSDYNLEFRLQNLRYFSQILWYIFARLNMIGNAMYGYQFSLKYDNRMIKYSSLPDKMQYRNYKKIKQLFEEGVTSHSVIKCIGNSTKRNYDIIVFSSCFDEVDHSEQVYSALREYLERNYQDKSIMIKCHPRETYGFDWNDENIEVGCADLPGEEVLDVFPDAELLFAGTSNLLVKVCRTKRNFKIITFSCIKSKRFRRHIEWDSQFLGITEDKFIYL